MREASPGIIRGEQGMALPLQDRSWSGQEAMTLQVGAVTQYGVTVAQTKASPVGVPANPGGLPA